MSNKLKGNTQKNNMGKGKQIIGYITDFVMLVDFLLLAVSTCGDCYRWKYE